jgi:hypothetical protein
MQMRSGRDQSETRQAVVHAFEVGDKPSLRDLPQPPGRFRSPANAPRAVKPSGVRYARGQGKCGHGRWRMVQGLELRVRMRA